MYKWSAKMISQVRDIQKTTYTINFKAQIAHATMGEASSRSDIRPLNLGIQVHVLGR